MKLLLLLGIAYTGARFKGDAQLVKTLRELPAKHAAAIAYLEQRLGVKMPRIEVTVTDGATPGVHAVSGPGWVRLHAGHLLAGALDVEKLLRHELFHCLHRARLGEKAYARLPAWAREGAAVWVAGQTASRARELAAWAGRAELGPVLTNGFTGPLRFTDYFEAASVFASLPDESALALVKRLMASPAIALANHEARARAYARKVLRPLLARGRDAFLEGRRLLERDPARASARLAQADGVYRPGAAFHRAEALRRLGRAKEALRALREGYLAHRREDPSLIGPAMVLEASLRSDLKDPGFEAARARALQILKLIK